MKNLDKGKKVSEFRVVESDTHGSIALCELYKMVCLDRNLDKLEGGSEISESAKNVILRGS